MPIFYRKNCINLGQKVIHNTKHLANWQPQSYKNLSQRGAGGYPLNVKSFPNRKTPSPGSIICRWSVVTMVKVDNGVIQLISFDARAL